MNQTKIKHMYYELHRELWRGIKDWYTAHRVEEWDEIESVKSEVIDNIIGCDMINNDCFLCHWYREMDPDPNPINRCFKCPCGVPSKIKGHEDTCHCMPYQEIDDLLDDEILGFNPENDEVQASIDRLFELFDEMINIKEV